MELNQKSLGIYYGVTLVDNLGPDDPTPEKNGDKPVTFFLRPRTADVSPAGRSYYTHRLR